MSTSYQEIQKQIAELQAKAEEARREEVAAARTKIQVIMHEFGLTIANISEVPPLLYTDLEPRGVGQPSPT